jgi:excisionase family DNA binding protein
MTEQGPHSVRQVAQALGVSSRTVHHRIARGDIKATKLGDGQTSAYLIDAAELARLLAAPRQAS